MSGVFPDEPTHFDPLAANAAALLLSARARRHLTAIARNAGVETPINWGAVRDTGSLPDELALLAVDALAHGRISGTEVLRRRGVTLSCPPGRMRETESVFAALPARAYVLRVDMQRSENREVSSRSTVRLKVDVPAPDPLTPSAGLVYEQRLERFYQANVHMLPFRFAIGRHIHDVDYAFSSESDFGQPEDALASATKEFRDQCTALLWLQFTSVDSWPINAAHAGRLARAALRTLELPDADWGESLRQVCEVIRSQDPMVAIHVPNLARRVERELAAARRGNVRKGPCIAELQLRSLLISIHVAQLRHTLPIGQMIPLSLELAEMHEAFAARLRPLFELHRSAIMDGLRACVFRHDLLLAEQRASRRPQSDLSDDEIQTLTVAILQQEPRVADPDDWQPPILE